MHLNLVSTTASVLIRFCHGTVIALLATWANDAKRVPMNAFPFLVKDTATVTKEETPTHVTAWRDIAAKIVLCVCNVRQFAQPMSYRCDMLVRRRLECGWCNRIQRIHLSLECARGMRMQLGICR